MTRDEIQVQQLITATGERSWTVKDGSGVIEPVERYLAHLAAIERSPNTVRAYAHDLRDYFAYLSQRALAWDRVRLEDIGGFIAWLRLPSALRSAKVVMLPSVQASLSTTTVNRKLSALSSFYVFHERHGVGLGELITRSGIGGRSGGSWKPFLVHLGAPRQNRRLVSLPNERRLPRALGEHDVRLLLDACETLQHRLLLTVLVQAGLRIGEALGLRHDDVDARRREIAIVSRPNENGARAKTHGRRVPVPSSLIRLYSDYLHEEYGALDCDYAFAHLSGSRQGHPVDYPVVDRLVHRLRRRSGVLFTPHELRHTYATDLFRRGVPAEIVKELLGHASMSTTVDTYSHLQIEDARRALEVAGVLDEVTA